ncbi:MAG TPA: phosphatase, partial [Actinomycetota bacterium]|nr:phosphatase [Actinomycetota bacterium]
VVLPREGELFGPGKVRIRYVGSVACLCDGASLLHTHSSEAMEALLEARPWPDIVLADHGYAGAALERGLAVVAFMDINDQALAVPWDEGKDVVIVPLDDNRPPRLYEPSWRLFEQILSGAEPAP